MDRHIKEFYSPFSDETPSGNFHSVIALHDEPHFSWEEIAAKAPRMCKGWYELTKLSPRDRLEFLCDYWLTKLPYHPDFKDFLIKFFGSLDNIGVFLVQKQFDDPYTAELVYSCLGGTGFYRGVSGASEEEITKLQQAFPNYTFPQEYLKFLQIHNGFSKATDSTGLLPCQSLKETYLNFQERLSLQETVMTQSGKPVEPKALIPFYESFGMPYYQCFYGEWYPEQEMGNVYYSVESGAVSDMKGTDKSSERMAFPTFLDWLMFYMEPVE